MRVSPKAGKLIPAAQLIDVSQLRAAYHDLKPDVSIASQRVTFGTSGHRGSSLDSSFNEWHVLSISQAICDYRQHHGITGPLFLGIDTHALSRPAFETALGVLTANGVDTMIAAADEYTPTPVVSHAILAYNHGRTWGLADGIVMTPSHNPPADGGYKYNPSNGGPAGTHTTRWIEERANILLAAQVRDVRHMAYTQARESSYSHIHDFMHEYIDDLPGVVDLVGISNAGIRMAVDPLGGAGVHYWPHIAEQYRLQLTVLSTEVDPTFAFLPADWDGQIRMDPSSRYAMQRLMAVKDQYDVAFACDTDHDRHGVVTKSQGLLPPNHYLCVLIDYLFQHRPNWDTSLAVGKTMVSTALIDRVAQRRGRRLFEVPVGFKWFADGLLNGSLGVVGEESAGASCLRRNGKTWTTDKDGIAAALLSAEITAKGGGDLGTRYQTLTAALGEPFAERRDVRATEEQKTQLALLSVKQITATTLAGGHIEAVLDRAPGNDAPLGGVKVATADGWFAVRPSGTEDIYKIYAESFISEVHLQAILNEAQQIVDTALAS